MADKPQGVVECPNCKGVQDGAIWETCHVCNGSGQLADRDAALVRVYVACQKLRLIGWDEIANACSTRYALSNLRTRRMNDLADELERVIKREKHGPPI